MSHENEIFLNDGMMKMEYDDRKKEIMFIAGKLFMTCGYENTTVNQIIHAANIAKGTFYYYFKSKEDLLDCVVEEQVNGVIHEQKKKIEQENWPIKKRMGAMILGLRLQGEDKQDIGNIHKTENVLMHQKFREKIITVLSPVLAKLIQEGNETGEFQAEYPLEYVKILLAATLVLTDDDWIEEEPNEKIKTVSVIVNVLELMLHVDKGYFSSVLEGLLGES